MKSTAIVLLFLVSTKLTKRQKATEICLALILRDWEVSHPPLCFGAWPPPGRKTVTAVATGSVTTGTHRWSIRVMGNPPPTALSAHPNGISHANERGRWGSAAHKV